MYGPFEPSNKCQIEANKSSGQVLKLIYHPLYSMNKFVTNKIKVATRWGTTVSLYGVIGYHVTLGEGHMIANHPI